MTTPLTYETIATTFRTTNDIITCTHNHYLGSSCLHTDYQVPIYLTPNQLLKIYQSTWNMKRLYWTNEVRPSLPCLSLFFRFSVTSFGSEKPHNWLLNYWEKTTFEAQLSDDSERHRISSHYLAILTSNLARKMECNRVVSIWYVCAFQLFNPGFSSEASAASTT